MADEKPKSNFRILVADEGGIMTTRLMDFLKSKGFEVNHEPGGNAVKLAIKNWKPHFVLCDLAIKDLTAPNLLRWLRSPEFDGEFIPRVLVTSAHNVVKNIRECIALGASDYIVKPFTFDDLLTRLVFHIQNKREVDHKTESPQAAATATDETVYMNLLDAAFNEIFKAKKQEDALFSMVKLISLTLKAVRCSVVQVSEDLLSGEVMASSDDKSARGIKLDMNKYPEVLHVMNTGKMIVIEDLAYDPQLSKIKDLVKGISFNSMILCPITRDNQPWGVVSARMDKSHSKFTDRDIRWTQLMGQILSLLFSARLFLPHELSIFKKSA